jgi:hypothetical protein
MFKGFVFFILLFLAGFAGVLHAAEPSSDAPEYARDSTVLFKAADSYEHALQIWKTPEDISAWIARNFSYDMARAMRLSETQRAINNDFSIYTPSEFFTAKGGVCVDLSRFGVETLRSIDPQSDPKYLMIEFAPMHVVWNTLRLHWLASFKRDGRTCFFADSKRPGHIAGPYKDTAEFIRDYEQYRGRRILAFREAESYQKHQRARALKLQASARAVICYLGVREAPRAAARGILTSSAEPAEADPPSPTAAAEAMAVKRLRWIPFSHSSPPFRTGLSAKAGKIGLTSVSIATELGISQSAVSRSITRAPEVLQREEINGEWLEYQ